MYNSQVSLFSHNRYQECLTVLPFEGAWVHPQFFVRSVLLVVLVFCVVFFYLFVIILSCVPDVAGVSGLSILDCPFGFL